jgi:cell division protein FtsB
METKDEHLEFLLYRVEAMAKELDRLRLENLYQAQKLEYYDNRNEVLTTNYNYLNYGN